MQEEANQFIFGDITKSLSVDVSAILVGAGSFAAIFATMSHVCSFFVSELIIRKRRLIGNIEVQ